MRPRTMLGFAVLLALPACDGSGPEVSPSADATIDPVQVTVHVLADDRVTAVAGVPVVFHDAAGAIVATVSTDADGVAIGEPGHNGAVTAFYPQDPINAQNEVVSVRNLAAEDDVVIVPPRDTPSTGTLQPMSVSFTAYPGAQYYNLHTPCTFGTPPSGNDSPISLTLDSRCDGAFDVVILAMSSSFIPIAYEIAHASYSANAVIDAGDQWLARQETTAAFTSPPSGGLFRVHHAWFDDTRHLELASEGLDASSGTVHPMIADMGGLEGLRASWIQGGTLGQRIYARADGTASTIDWGAASLPTISPVGWEGGEYTWGESGGNPAAITVITVEGHGSGNFTFRWTVFQAAGLTSFAFPAVPDELARYRQDPGFLPNAQVRLYDLDGMSYEDAHPTFARDLRDPEFLYTFDVAVESGISQL